MRKITSVYLMLLLLSLCGYESQQIQNALIFDTAVTLAADCGNEVLNGVFALCEEHDRRISKTNAESKIYKLNGSSAFTEKSNETKRNSNHPVFYSGFKNEALNITHCGSVKLYDFKNQVIPQRKEVAEAFQNIEYESA